MNTNTLTQNHFHTALADFFNSNDAAGHIGNLTALCLAFTGNHQHTEGISRLQIANMVYSADLIKDFIIDIDASSISDAGMSALEARHIGQIIDGNAASLINAIPLALQEWIFPTYEDHSIDALSEALDSFQRISDLITLCSKIHLTNKNRLEGGASC